ncbi:hypothetical protein BGZ63DRAFT_420813 [Mariannaea sp. PMI_226]|nr:hypothetical protein BGZ63DRAFT_420813 [Mariannaea sp. PMI_226]
MSGRAPGRRVSSVSWADEVMEHQDRQGNSRSVGAFPGPAERNRYQRRQLNNNNYTSSQASDSRGPLRDISNDFIPSSSDSGSTFHQRNSSPPTINGSTSHHHEEVTRGRQMERTGSVSRERTPEGPSSGNIARAMSGFYVSSPPLTPAERRRRTALDPLRVPARLRDAFPEGRSSGNIARALRSPNPLSQSRAISNGRTSDFNPSHAAGQVTVSDSSDNAPDRSPPGNNGPSRSASFAVGYPHDPTHGRQRQTAMNPFNSVGRVPATTAREPSPTPSWSSDASTTIVHLQVSSDSMREHLRSLEYLDLETREHVEVTNETRQEIRTTAGDLSVKEEDWDEYNQFDLADHTSGMTSPSEYTNAMQTAQGSEVDDINGGENYTTDPSPVTGSADRSASPFAGYFINRSAEELQQRPPVLEPANHSRLPPEYSDYEQGHPAFQLQPRFGVWTPEGRQRILFIMQSLGLSVYMPVAMLERYLLNNRSIIYHAAGGTTPMRPNVNGDCLQTIATGAAYQLNTRLYTAMREVGWHSVELLDVLARASAPGARYEGVEEEFNRRNAAGRVLRRREH